MVSERARGESTEGVQLAFRAARLGVASSSERGEFSAEAAAGPWALGFRYTQVFPGAGARPASAAAVGARFRGPRARLAAAFQIPPALYAKVRLGADGGWAVAAAIVVDPGPPPRASLAISARHTER
jgi:hypothetical protein